MQGIWECPLVMIHVSSGNLTTSNYQYLNPKEDPNRTWISQKKYLTVHTVDGESKAIYDPNATRKHRWLLDGCVAVRSAHRGKVSLNDSNMTA